MAQRGETVTYGGKTYTYVQTKINYNGNSVTYAGSKTLPTAGRVMSTDMTVEPLAQLEEVTLTSNQTIVYNGEGDGWNKVTVAVPSDINNESREANPSLTDQTISPSSAEYSGLSSVKINKVIVDGLTADKVVSGHTVSVGFTGSPSGLVEITGSFGSDASATPGDLLYGKSAYTADGKIEGQIETKTSSNVSANGPTVNIPVGYYPSGAVYTIDSAPHNAPSISVDNSGLVKAVHTQAAGYVSAGSVTNTMQLSTEAEKTVTPTTSEQLVVGEHKYTLGDIKVAPIPAQYVVPSGTLPIVDNGTYPVGQYANVEVNVPVGETINNQNKSVTMGRPSVTVTADAGYTGLGTVEVSAPTASIVASGGDINCEVQGIDFATWDPDGIWTGNNYDTHGIPIDLKAYVQVSRGDVVYNQNVNGWVVESTNDVILSNTSTSTNSIAPTFYLTKVNIPYGKTFTANATDGTLVVDTDAGEGNVQIEHSEVSIGGTLVTNSSGNLITASLPAPSITQSGNTVTAQVNLTDSGWITPGIATASFTVSGDTPTFTNIGTATTNVSGAYVTSGSNYYVNSITVPSGKTITITNNGTANINGGNVDKGIQLNGRTAIVDRYTVTDSNGDLLVPTYNSTTKALNYPTTWTSASGSTSTYPTLSGEVTTINGLAVKDTNAVTGSGTAAASTYSYNLAKISSSKVLSNGAHVTISENAPSGGSSGDIWFEIA